MQIDIIIPHHGDPGPTVALIDQLRPQCAGIIVVDDHSPVPFPDLSGVTIVRRDINGGFGSAVNAGAAVADGDWLLVLNSDLDVPEHFVDDMAAAAERYGSSVLSPHVLDSHHQPVWVGRDFPLVRHQVAEWLTLLARWRHTSLWHRAVGHDLRVGNSQDAEVDWVIGAAMLIPLDLFRAVGGFDERFFMNCEEVDLQFRMHQRGVPSIALAHPTVVHSGGGSSPSVKRRAWLVDSRLGYAEKWGSRRALRAALLMTTILNFIVNSIRRTCGRSVKPIETARDELRLLSRQRGDLS